MNVVRLRKHQNELADAIEAAWRAGIRRPLGHLCVGSGKSLGIAELARRGMNRGERSLTLVHRQELALQNQSACNALGMTCGLNVAKLGERTWRAPAIVAMINSVYRNAQSFGPIDNILIDECHLVPHSEAGMYREFLRNFPNARIAGFSGTPHRLVGGSLVEGEEAPFDKVVYSYTIIDGIRDGYLVPAYSIGATDQIDASKLTVRQGEYTGASQDEQMIALMDSHILQMLPHRNTRRGWLGFEASVKAARLMCERMNAWGIRTGLVIGEMPNAERERNIAAYRRQELQALVGKEVLTVGFDVPHTDLLFMRFKTMSPVKYEQVIGRLLRTIGGNIEASIAAGKSDGILYDFGKNIETHGPLDFIRPLSATIKLVKCDECGKRNASAAARCWSCDAVMTKLCPACLATIRKGDLDCPNCQHDMRVERSEPTSPKLFELPSGAALISSWKGGVERAGGWLPVRKVWTERTGVVCGLIEDGTTADLVAFAAHAPDVRWLRRAPDGSVAAVLLPNGAARLSARQISADGSEVIVPMPAAVPSRDEAAVVSN